MSRKVEIRPYRGPSGGWGSVRSLGTILKREGNAVSSAAALRHQNKDGGFACVSCAWGKPSPPHAFEFCENGAKATAWDLTSETLAPDFFRRHPVRALEAMSDHELEQAGRLTEPMRWNADTDCYEPVSWEDAFRDIAAELRAMPPAAAVFYASGRAANEAAFMYQLLARMYGSNNLPDSSNMCHESTSVALPKSIGVPVGTVAIKDFEDADCILIFGQNAPTNSPRMLHQLDQAAQRGVPIINFNPLRERGLERFINPQNPLQMLSTCATPLLAEDHRLRGGGDLAAMVGICRALLDGDEASRSQGGAPLLDWDFIHQHTQGLEAFAQSVRAHGWPEIEARSGLTRAALEGVARRYAAARSTIGIYGMGLTQHRMGVETVRMLCSLLLLRGNIGRPGAGICPVRGHSNVQGQRAVWITEKPELAPLDRFTELFDFVPPRDKGLDAVGAAAGVISGEVRAVLQLGGNLIRSLPERGLLEPAWRRLRMTVMIATKLNRSHLVHGEVAYLLPCLSRIEIDRQASGPQLVSVEDSNCYIHASGGVRAPASRRLRSEPAIIAGIARALFAENPKVPWQDWVGDYRLVRRAIAACHPEWYRDYDARMRAPGGFPRDNPARRREWRTPSGRAEFSRPDMLEADPDARAVGGDVLELITLRSNDQFNTTIYGYDDRFRGIAGSRDIVMMNAADMARLGLVAKQRVTLATAVNDGVRREVEGLQVVPYELPPGYAAGYFPECNPLLPLWHHALESHVPAAKSIPVRIIIPAAARGG